MDSLPFEIPILVLTTTVPMKVIQILSCYSWLLRRELWSCDSMLADAHVAAVHRAEQQLLRGYGSNLEKISFVPVAMYRPCQGLRWLSRA